jgi:hypothetical protein
VDKRPAVIGVLGWGWGILGGLMFISGGMALLMSTIMNRMSPGGFPPAQATAKFPAQFAPMLVVFQYFWLLALCQLLLAGFIVFSAMQFLKLREWVRLSLLAISGLAALYVVSFSIFWMYMWVSITGAAQMPQANMPPGFMWIGIVGATVNMVIFTTPLILSIVALRGKVVREAFAAG